MYSHRAPPNREHTLKPVRTMLTAYRSRDYQTIKVFVFGAESARAALSGLVTVATPYH
jgi:hypothetical protein